MESFLTAVEHHGWTVFWLVVGLVYLLKNLPRCCCRRHEDDEDGE